MPIRRNMFSWEPTLPISARFGIAAVMAAAMLAACSNPGSQRVVLQSSGAVTPAVVTTTTLAVHTFYGVVNMGPQAMEGDPENVKNGNVLTAGYDFSMPGSHPAATVTFFFPPGPPDAFNFKYACNSGDDSEDRRSEDSPDTLGNIYVEPPNQVYHSLLNNRDWIPTAKQSDPSGYQGKTTLATTCGTRTINLSRGGTFRACITEQTTDAKPDPINVRWHYSIVGSPGGWSTTRAVALSTSHYANSC